jgi:hypothetical protein
MNFVVMFSGASPQFRVRRRVSGVVVASEDLSHGAIVDFIVAERLSDVRESSMEVTAWTLVSRSHFLVV